MTLIESNIKYDRGWDSWCAGFRFADGDRTITVSGRWRGDETIEAITASARRIAMGDVDRFAFGDSLLAWERTVERAVDDVATD